MNKIILFPRKTGKYAKKAIVPEAKEAVLAGADAKVQNTTRAIIALPKPSAGYEWTKISKDMKDANVFKVLRTELKTTKGFYKKMEERKKKLAGGKK